jgi:ubiquinone/menaquinone biosynthesis C-methylase UbiE
MPDYNSHWEDKFITGSWGRYPPEDLIRFVGRHFSANQRSDMKVLEVGCGPGANLWFLHREGFSVAGIDSSSTAMAQAGERLVKENHGINDSLPDLRTGNFASLEWEDSTFDLVIDIFALYANTIEIMQSAISEIHRVLKPGALLYSKLWGRRTEGYGEGDELEEGTYMNIPIGPCAEMGVAHFFTPKEITSVFSMFEPIVIDRVARSDNEKGFSLIEEFHCQFRKAI